MENRTALRTWGARVAAAGGVLVVATLIAPTQAGAVGPHQHEVVNPAGSHDIANGFCNGNFGTGTPQNVAITNFHTNIHVGPGGPEGLVTIEGGPC